MLAGLGLVGLAALNSTPSSAQSTGTDDKSFLSGQLDSRNLKSANVGVMTLMTGGIDGISSTYYQLAKDMSSVLDVRNELRILPVIGYGSLQNVEDLLYLKGIDLSMVNADVMRHMDQRKVGGGAKSKVQYITKLYDQSLHVLANKRIANINQLNGETVIVGRPGTGNEMSALTLITDLGLNVNVVHVEFDEAVEQLREGQAAAMIVVTRKPSDRLRTIAPDSGLHFLPVPMTDRLLRTYDQEPLTAADYPNLVQPGAGVVSPQTSAVLAVYNWKPGTSRYANVVKFIDAFSEKMILLNEARGGDVWKKMDVVAEVKGWQRFKPALALVQDAITARAQSTATIAPAGVVVDETDPEFELFAKYIRSTAKKDVSDTEMRALFDKFKVWGQNRSN